MATTKTLRQAGALSATWVLSNNDESFVRFGAADWSLLPTGPLKAVLAKRRFRFGGDLSRTALFADLAAAGVKASTIGGEFVGGSGNYEAAFDIDNDESGYGPVQVQIMTSSSYPESAIVFTLSVTSSVEA